MNSLDRPETLNRSETDTFYFHIIYVVDHIPFVQYFDRVV